MRTLAALACIGISVTALHSGDPQRRADTEAPIRAEPDQVGVLPPSFKGRVVAVTGKTLRIQPTGDLQITSTTRGFDGAVKRLVYVQDNTVSPREFVFHDSVLHREGVLPTYRGATCPSWGHRIADLKVGDVILLDCRQDKGVDYCIEMTIQRRPGGKLPPRQNDPHANTRGALHLRDQAHQDWEEKGVPIPKKYLDKDGQAPDADPPYPPVAPMPRAAKP